MSSSQANASARRRRAAPPPTGGMAPMRGPPAPQQMRGPNQPQARPGTAPGGQQSIDQGTPKAPLTPAQMLIAHERRLTEIERIIPEMIHDLGLDEAEDVAKATLNVQFNEQSNSSAATDMLDLTRRIEAIEISMKTFGSASSGGIANVEFMGRADELEARINTLTELVHFVQKFTMETNMTLMRLMKKLGVDTVDDETRLDGPTIIEDNGDLTLDQCVVDNEASVEHTYNVGR